MDNETRIKEIERLNQEAIQMLLPKHEDMVWYGESKIKPTRGQFYFVNIVGDGLVVSFTPLNRFDPSEQDEVNKHRKTKWPALYFKVKKLTELRANGTTVLGDVRLRATGSVSSSPPSSQSAVPVPGLKPKPKKKTILAEIRKLYNDIPRSKIRQKLTKTDLEHLRKEFPPPCRESSFDRKFRDFRKELSTKSSK
jgi:hypothetical protein